MKKGILCLLCGVMLSTAALPCISNAKTLNYTSSISVTAAHTIQWETIIKA